MDDRRVGRQLGRRPGLTVSGDRTIDQLWIELPQRAIVQVQSSHHAGAEIFDENIRFRHQLPDGLNGVGRFQVENDALLAEIELAEDGTETIADRRTGSHRLPFDRLDLDDLRAHVGQHSGAMRTGDRGGKIQHAKAPKTLCQNALIVVGYRHRKLPRPRTFSRGVTLNCTDATGKRISRHHLLRSLKPSTTR